MKFLNPIFIRDKVKEIKEHGVKAFIKTYGWKVVAFVVLFYLVRDTILYIIIPYLILNNFVTCQ